MNKKNKAQPVKLTEKNLNTFIDILDGWSGKLTWELLIDAFERRTGRRITRQALDRHDLIKNAFQVRKEKSRNTTGPSPETKSSEVQVVLDRCARLEGEVERLKAQNHNYCEQFVRWLYNSNLRGIRIDELDAPMSHVDRDSSRS